MYPGQLSSLLPWKEIREGWSGDDDDGVFEAPVQLAWASCPRQHDPKTTVLTTARREAHRIIQNHGCELLDRATNPVIDRGDPIPLPCHVAGDVGGVRV